MDRGGEGGKSEDFLGIFFLGGPLLARVFASVNFRSSASSVDLLRSEVNKARASERSEAAALIKSDVAGFTADEQEPSSGWEGESSMMKVG